MGFGQVCWIVAVLMTVSGLVAVMRYRVALGACLILAAIGVGLLGATT